MRFPHYNNLYGVFLLLFTESQVKSFLPFCFNIISRYTFSWELAKDQDFYCIVFLQSLFTDGPVFNCFATACDSGIILRPKLRAPRADSTSDSYDGHRRRTSCSPVVLYDVKIAPYRSSYR